jgi:hypothetical protein
MLAGLTAQQHPLPIQINTPYSTFNSIKWANGWGMGWGWANWCSGILVLMI